MSIPDQETCEAEKSLLLLKSRYLAAEVARKTGEHILEPQLTGGLGSNDDILPPGNIFEDIRILRAHVALLEGKLAPKTAPAAAISKPAPVQPAAPATPSKPVANKEPVNAAGMTLTEKILAVKAGKTLAAQPEHLGLTAKCIAARSK